MHKIEIPLISPQKIEIQILLQFCMARKCNTESSPISYLQNCWCNEYKPSKNSVVIRTVNFQIYILPNQKKKQSVLCKQSKHTISKMSLEKERGFSHASFFSYKHTITVTGAVSAPLCIFYSNPNTSFFFLGWCH